MSHRVLVIQNDDLSGPGTLDQALHDLGCEPDLWLAQRDPDRRCELGDFAAVLAFGGRSDPQKETGWLAHERELIEAALELEVPYLGVCLGGELLAQVVGGGAPSDPPTQIGWKRVEATAAAGDDPLLHDVGRTVFEFHYNGIKAPASATVLARRKGVDEAFRVGQRAWGIQFHLEVDLDMVWRFLVEEASSLRDHGVDPNELRRQTAQVAPPHVEWARAVVERFVGLLDA